MVRGLILNDEAKDEPLNWSAWKRIVRGVCEWVFVSLAPKSIFAGF